MTVKKDRPPRTSVLRLRATPAERRTWEEAARKVDRPLSAWLRWVANEYVGQTGVK